MVVVSGCADPAFEFDEEIFYGGVGISFGLIGFAPTFGDKDGFACEDRGGGFDGAADEAFDAFEGTESCLFGEIESFIFSGGFEFGFVSV